MPSLCTNFQESSAYVNNWLTQQPAVKEESLTDWLLFDVSARIPNVHYHAFTRHQEARNTGADWEWWFVFRNCAVCFRVQAKKVVDSDNYGGIARTNAHGLQIDMLLSDAHAANAILVYAFYSDDTRPIMCNNVSSPVKDGVFVAGGQKIYDSFIAGSRQNVGAADLLRISNPFSCFACCPLLHKDRRGMRCFLEMYYPAETMSYGENNDDLVGFHSQVPPLCNSTSRIFSRGITRLVGE